MDRFCGPLLATGKRVSVGNSDRLFPFAFSYHLCATLNDGGPRFPFSTLPLLHLVGACDHVALWSITHHLGSVILKIIFMLIHLHIVKHFLVEQNILFPLLIGFERAVGFDLSNMGSKALTSVAQSTRFAIAPTTP